MNSPKKAKLNNAYIAPEGGGISGGLNFDSLVGNSQINGMVGLNEMRFGLNQTYPLTNNLGLQGELNYSSYNYPDFQGSNKSGNLGLNYSKKVGDSLDLDLSSSINLDKEGLSPGFRVGLRKRFGEGGPLAAFTGNTLNKFILTEDEIDKYKDKAATCHENSGENCAAGAFNFNVNNVSGQLGTVPLREGLQKAFPEGTNISQTPYSIKSKEKLADYADEERKIEFMHNQSIDSWEMYNMYKGNLNRQNELGTLLHDHKNGTFKENAENWKKIPIGAIITQGTTRHWKGAITSAKDEGSSHTTTVVGFDQDGMPLVYDYGKIQRINSKGRLGRSALGYSINDIFVPKGYENFTYDNVKNRIENYNAGLGYKTKEGEPITDAPNKYSRSYINDIKNALDENEAAIGQRYNISKDIMDKIQNRVIGIGAQESNLNNYGDVKEIDKTSESGFKDHDSSKQRWADNATSNAVWKPIAKGVGDLFSVVTDSVTGAFDDREEKSDWNVEILTEDRLNKEGIEFKYGDDTWRKAYNEMRGEYAEPRMTAGDVIDKDYTSSRGPFKVKNFPESAGKLLRDRDGDPLDSGDLQISGGGSIDELRYGANVAAIHISENYNRMKKRYNEEKGFNLTDDQLIDIATVAYNNNKKSMSDEFVKRFIQSDTLKDGYLTNVKRYEKLYLEQEKLKPGESTKDDVIAEDSSKSTKDLDMLKKNAAAAEKLMTQPPVQQLSYGGMIYGKGGPLMPYMFPQQMKDGGKFLGLTGSQWGAGTAGALQGVAGSLLPGQVGDMAVKGIGSVHGMIDKDVTDQDRAIMGGARAAGAGVTAIATGGATLAAGADDMVVGTKDAVKHGTEWGQENAGALDVVGGLAATAAGGAAGGAADGGGMKGAGQGMAQAFGMPGGGNAGGTPGINGGGQNFAGQGNPNNGTSFTGGTAGDAGGFTGQQNMNGSNNINMNNIMNMVAGQGGMQGGGQGGMDPQQMMNLAKQFGLMGYGGPLMMAQGGSFKPHPMYKDGQMVMANDHATHLKLKEQGYGHQKMEAGGLMSIENGGTHEQNPMGGVPVGPNALVEQGETIMDLKDQVEGGKFVFSDRRGPKGKRGSTWADLSKRVERKYKDREGDAAAKRAMDQELIKVAQAQEEQKAKEMAKLQKQMTELIPSPMSTLPPEMTAGAPKPPQNMEQGMGQGMPAMPGQMPPMPQMAKNGGLLYGMGGMAAGQMPMQPNMNQGLSPDMTQALEKMGGQPSQQPMNMGQQPQMGGQPMHQMPDGTMMPGATHQDAMNMGAYGYGGKVKKYGMGGPIMYPGGGMIPYSRGGRMQYGYGGSLNIPQEDIGYIEQMIDFELAHGSADGTGLSYGAWSKNQASDRDSAIEFIYNKYVTPNKDLPVELRKRAADMHLNSEDPRASLMVAAGVIDPSQKGNIYRNKAEVTKLMEKDLGHKPTEKEYQANKKKYLGLQEDRLNAAWDKHKDKVVAKYNDPAFVEAFDKEKHRSYKGNNNSAGMYGKSQKYRIDMWNPKAANYRNPANYKNTDYDGGQPTVGSAQFGTKAQDVKQGLNTALGMDDASKAQTAAELDQRKAEMQADASVPDFLQGNFDDQSQGFMGTDIDGNPQMIGANAPDGAMAMDPNDPNAFQGVPFRNPNDPNAPGNNPNEYTGDFNYGYERPEYVDPLTGEEIDYDPYDTDNQQLANNQDISMLSGDQNLAAQGLKGTMPDVYEGGPSVDEMMNNSSVGGQEVNTDFLEGDFANQTSMQEQPPQPQGEPFSTDVTSMLGLGDNQFVNPQNPGDNTEIPFMTPEQLEAQKQKELLAQRAANGENPDGTLDIQQYKDRGMLKDYEEEFNPDDYVYASDGTPVNAGPDESFDNSKAGGPSQFFGSQEDNPDLLAAQEKAAQEKANKKRIRNRNLGIAGGALANSAGDIYNLAQGLKKPEEIKYDRINSEEVNLNAQRNMLKKQAGSSLEGVRKGMRRSGDISSLVAAHSALDENLGQGLAKSYLDQDTTNIGIRNKDKIMNQKIDTEEQIANQQAKAKQRLLVEQGLHGIGANTAGAMKDIRQSNQVDRNNANQINAMNTMFKDFDWDKLGTMLKFTGGNKNKTTETAAKGSTTADD